MPRMWLGLTVGSLFRQWVPRAQAKADTRGRGNVMDVCVVESMLHSIVVREAAVVSRDGRGTVCTGFVTRVGTSEGKLYFPQTRKGILIGGSI